MKTDPKLKTLARKLAQMCMHNGQAAHNRVTQVLQSLEPMPVARRRETLKLFHDALKRELAIYEAHVEHAGPFSEDALKALLDQLKAAVGHTLRPTLSEKPELLAGFRVRVGDDVYDASVRSKLDRIAAIA